MAGGPRQVVWTLTAREDLDNILTYVAEDSADAALHVLEAVLGSAASLDSLSERGRVVPELGLGSVREVFVLSYRLMYRVTKSQVFILAIVHGARDFGEWWRDDLGE